MGIVVIIFIHNCTFKRKLYFPDFKICIRVRRDSTSDLIRIRVVPWSLVEVVTLKSESRVSWIGSNSTRNQTNHFPFFNLYV